MAKPKNFTVKVFEAPAMSRMAVVPGRALPKPRQLRGFTVSERSLDKARGAAKKRVASMGRLQSLSVLSDGSIQCILMHPEDATKDKPDATQRGR